MKRVVILCVWLFSVVAGHAQLSIIRKSKFPKNPKRSV